MADPLPNRTPPIEIESADDPRIAVFARIKDRELAADGDRFIAEGEFIFRRLVASSYAIESVLMTPRHAGELAPLVPAATAVYTAPEELMGRIIGFPFHLGVISCGRRRPLLTVDQAAPAWGRHLTLMILPEINSTENLGSLLRIAGAFGADAVILGQRACDPFYRQAIRVSMGAVFSLTLVRSPNILADLRRLKDMGIELAATVLHGPAEELPAARRGPRLGILFGPEAQGLAPEHVGLCDRRISIPMEPGADSLNVAVAAGVFMYHFTQDNIYDL